jgi:photosystem II stability/assembly factor-like uncharacterized protein
MVYKRFTCLLQLFTAKNLRADSQPVALLYCFTTSMIVMKIIYNLAFLLLFQFLSCNQAPEFPQASHLTDNQQKQEMDEAEAANTVLKSTDGGQTWQDISNGLPKPVKDDNGVGRNVSFADDNGLYLAAGNGIYHNKPNATTPFWTKEIFPGEHSSIAPGKTGIFAYDYDGHFLQKINGTSKWSPIYTNFQQKRVRSIFESAAGSIFISSDYGLFKSTDSGKTWRRVYTGGGAFRVVESGGVLMAICGTGIIRSTDDGESWDFVINEERRGFAVESIKGGFAVIFYPTASDTRKVRTSCDGGKTWQSIDEGLPVKGNITSIIQVGENLFCANAKGVLRSSDKGKKWKLILPAIKDKVFHLSVSGNVIYTIPRPKGC